MFEKVHNGYYEQYIYVDERGGGEAPEEKKCYL